MLSATLQCSNLKKFAHGAHCGQEARSQTDQPRGELLPQYLPASHIPSNISAHFPAAPRRCCIRKSRFFAITPQLFHADQDTLLLELFHIKPGAMRGEIALLCSALPTLSFL